MNQNDHGDDGFRAAMRDVVRHQPDNRVALTEKRPSAVSQAKRREAATEEVRADSNFLSGDHVEAVDPHAILEFKRDGVQHGVYRNLRLGKYTIDARLDLHRMTVDTARRAVYQFVKDCMAHDIRCALITHGKGVGREQPALLKSCIAHWLPQFEEVLAFHSAQKQHGASGATYILLRKSERKRLDNWERQHKRRS
ncbi:DNA endonuclease SmrA [Marinimicrobium alkaliphilum]|uniref:DNA endonuclease SmrA n=1 Tax=Marinimicrobium alkaliphilum TaxID=2202654 RepID=UPI000DBA2009|nr:DNA endonuclease SmrA [Marinimicrobium alkaliphilum]